MPRQKLSANIIRVRGPTKGITEYRLTNGLKVLLMPDHSSAVVMPIVVYKVGSRNEGPGNTGSAHFFEHLMFKGSKNFNPDNGKNIDLLAKEIGAGMNAFTSNDQTVYFVEAPAEHLELCLAIEADRMRGLRMTVADRDSEMTVVRNEMEQGENRPRSVMYKQMYATAFTQHPYHHDTIGSRTEVENVPMAKMREFYDTYYHPNNATLIIVGNFETQAALGMIERHFAKIPKSASKIPHVYTVEPRQEGERRFEIRRAGNMYRLSLGYHVPEAVHADMPALEVLSHVLGNSYSRSSRLYKRLVSSGLSTEVYAYVQPMRDPGLFTIDADLNENTSLPEAEAALLDEIDKLKTELISDQELERIKLGEYKRTRLSLAIPKNFGFQLANAEAVADWQSLFTGLDAFKAVTAEDVRRVASKYLTKDNRTVGAFIPKSDEEVEQSRSEETVTDEPTAVAVKPRARKNIRPVDPQVIEKTVARFAGKAPARKPLSQRIVKRVLDNGLTIQVVKEKSGSGAIAVAAAIKAGNYYESKDKQNLADIVGTLLTQGSQGLTKEQLADQLTTMGLSTGLHVGVGPFLANIRVGLLVEDVPRFLTLLSTVVREPAFEQGELETAKNQWKNFYKENSSSPNGVAQNTLGNVLYQVSDTFFQKTLEEQAADLEKMTREDLVAYHRTCYTPGNTIITIVGDIEPETAFAHVAAVFAGWEGLASAPVRVPSPAVLKAGPAVVKQMPDKPGIAILLGHPVSIKKSDPDWDALELGLNVLGGDTLTARLGKKLREEGGLTYGVYAGQWDNSHGGSPLYISLSVNKANIDKALAVTHEIVADFVINGITDDELKSQVKNMAGEQLLRLDSLNGLAGQISERTALGISIDSIDSYGASLRKLSKEDVNAAIRKHLDPTRLVTIIAGDVN